MNGDRLQSNLPPKEGIKYRLLCGLPYAAFHLYLEVGTAELRVRNGKRNALPRPDFRLICSATVEVLSAVVLI